MEITRSLPQISLPAEAGHLFYTLFTADLLPFARNWLCSVRPHLGGGAALVVAAEQRMCEQLSPWLVEAVRCIDGNGRQNARRENMSVEAGSPTYVDAVRQKMELIYQVTHQAEAAANSSGLTLAIFVDVDVVLHADPVAPIRRMAKPLVMMRNSCPALKYDVNTGPPYS